VTPQEIEEIRRRVSAALTAEHKVKLQPAVERVKEFTKALERRPFVQVIGGSAAKKEAAGSPRRCYNIYGFEGRGGRWEVKAESFFWRYSGNCFDEEAAEYVALYPEGRTLEAG